jgi:hypothetical protein
MTGYLLRVVQYDYDTLSKTTRQHTILSRNIPPETLEEVARLLQRIGIKEAPRQ